MLENKNEHVSSRSSNHCRDRAEGASEIIAMGTSNETLSAERNLQSLEDLVVYLRMVSLHIVEILLTTANLASHGADSDTTAAPLLLEDNSGLAQQTKI